MGQAMQLVPTTLWQRLRRQQPTFTSEIASSWKLISRRQYPRSDPAVALIEPPPAPLDEGATATALVPEADPDESMPPPGTMAASGMACPASGWWRCLEAHALDGTRWFGRGQSLPMASVRQQLSMLERFKGTLEVTPHKAPWQFVRHDGGAKSAPAQPAATDDSADKPA